ncbi:nucleoside deaminase [Vicingaceae bacterium]|nr:nucleoside deaminase [Vicingaceae bacterium]MDB4061792.1 nucleoside deaminase [Vicingaceae bacterium]MDC1451764.1 nucleoside deaminase [Vicingaceae bacterium]
MIQPFDDNYFMKQALNEANLAFDKDEIPIGAIVVHDFKIIARAHNLTETLNDVTAHAEMQAFTAAADFLGGKYLKECTLYVTLEPCVMCAGASYWTQLKRIVYGANDERPRQQAIDKTALFHPKTGVVSGIMAEDCKDLLRLFFEEKRK